MLLRLRVVTAIMAVAIVVIIALPGMFPLWFKLEQGVAVCSCWPWSYRSTVVRRSGRERSRGRQR